MTAMAVHPRPFPESAEPGFTGDQQSPFPSLRRRRVLVDESTGRTRVRVTSDKDNGEYFAMMRRMIRAAARRVKAEDPSTLAEFDALRKIIDEYIGDAALSLHDQGWSWGEIGQEIGIGRHAARKRWHR